MARPSPSAASLRTDLELARQEITKLRTERDKLRQNLHKQLGRQLDQLTHRELTTRIDELTQQRQTDSPLTHNQRNTALQRRSAKSSLRVETSGTRSDEEAGCRLPQRRGRRSARGRPRRLRCQQGSDDEGVACE